MTFFTFQHWMVLALSVRILQNIRRKQLQIGQNISGPSHLYSLSIFSFKSSSWVCNQLWKPQFLMVKFGFYPNCLQSLMDSFQASPGKSKPKLYKFHRVHWTIKIKLTFFLRCRSTTFTCRPNLQTVGIGTTSLEIKYIFSEI